MPVPAAAHDLSSTDSSLSPSASPAFANIPVTKNEVKFVADASDDDEEVSISTTISFKYLKYWMIQQLIHNLLLSRPFFNYLNCLLKLAHLQHVFPTPSHVISPAGRKISPVVLSQKAHKASAIPEISYSR